MTNCSKRENGRKALIALFVLLLAMSCLPSIAFSQADSTRRSSQGIKKGDAPPKGAAKKAKRPGFDLPDSLYNAVDSIRGDIDTVVYYTGKDSTVFDINVKRMTLTGEATLDFRTQHINAHRITMDMIAKTLTATSTTYDSVIAASTGKQRRIIRDTARVKSRGAPKLIDGSTVYEGESIIYNFKSKQGNVALATSSLEGGYYSGEKIKQVAPQTLFIQNGRYTTCDAPTPHFYFESPKMKLISGDEVFAEPVYLYIADVPIFVLPFAVFPQHTGGRHSGLIAPGYQTTGNRGYGLTHLGYYHVFSDYFDAAIQTDLYTRGGYNLAFNTQYMKRYVLSSPIALNLGYSKTRTSLDDPYTTDFNIGLGMGTLNIDPVTTLSGNLHFTSNGYTRNNAQNINDVVNQVATSSASFHTSLEQIDFSFDASYSRNQNLRDGTYTETSPSLSWSKMTAINPFGSPSDGESSNILKTLRITYGGNASRTTAKTQVKIAADSLRCIEGDTSFRYRESYSINHFPSISISPKLGYISITPSFSYNEQWFLRRKTKSARLQITACPTIKNGFDTSVVFDEQTQTGFYREPNYNYGISFGTTLYGNANLGFFGLKAIRHVLSPSVSLNYNPDFSANGTASYIDPKTGQPVPYSIYELDNGYRGSGKSGRIGISLANDFEAKIEHRVNPDSTYDEKVKLLNIGIGTGYDIVQKLFSPLSVSGYSQVGSLFSFNVSAGFSWYPYNYSGGDSTAHTLIALKQGLLRLTNTSFSLNGSFSSSETTEGENVDSLRRFFDVTSPDVEREMFFGGYYPGRFVSVPFRPKWNTSYRVSYDESFNKSGITRSLRGGASLTLNLTPNWSFTTSADYDFVAGSFVVPNLRVHRDLHCWEINFDYRPVGLIKGFNLEIRIKADQLRDIKLTRQESTYGTF